MTSAASRRTARDLHPLAWWGWALGLAAAASLVTNPVLLLLLVAIASLVVAARRGDHPWSRAFRLYLVLGAVIVTIRVGFRVLLGGGAYPGATVWLRLPEVPLPDWVAGVTLLGDVTRESVLGGLYDGLRLAAIVICVGAANALANPKRLLRSLPAAFYEVGTALVVAVTVLPQLASSLTRVRRAQQLRGGHTGRVAGLRRTVVPVLEDALERSLMLAAGMDARGYGRTVGGARDRRRTTALLLGALVALAAGVYGTLDTTAPRWLAWPMLALGAVLAGLGVAASGRTVRRTRYRPDPWRAAETVTVLSGLVVLGGVLLESRWHELVVRPDVTVVPTVGALLLLTTLVGLLPAVAAPPVPEPRERIVADARGEHDADDASSEPTPARRTAGVAR